MSPLLVSLLFGLGVGGFVWSKISLSTGNARPASVTMAAAVAGIAAFIFFFTLLKFVFSM